MLIYVAHKYGGDLANVERAAKITHDLQIKDTENCYICPLLVFRHLNYCELDYDTEINLCIDLLSVCDKLLIASDISKGVEIEKDFAELVGMETEYLRDIYKQ